MLITRADPLTSVISRNNRLAIKSNELGAAMPTEWRKIKYAKHASKMNSQQALLFAANETVTWLAENKVFSLCVGLILI